MPFNNDEFLKVFDDIFKSCKDILNAKGHDYSDADNDRLSNFKDVANLMGIEAKQVWAVYFLKHIFAILTWTKGKELKSETLRGRAEDAINYMILGYALYLEEEENAKQNKPVLKYNPYCTCDPAKCCTCP